MLQTEFEFQLPRGYVDERGDLHRDGTMRLATAIDEIEPMQDPRFRANAAYLSILLLSRVVTRLGDIRPVSPSVIEGLFATDFGYLQSLYIQLNDTVSVDSEDVIETECPECRTRFSLDLAVSDQ